MKFVFSLSIIFTTVVEVIKKINNYFFGLVDDLSEHPFRTLAVIFIFYFVDYAWGFEVALYLALFFLILFFRWDTKILLGLGLIFVFASPVFLLKMTLKEVDVYTTYGYYFLFFGIIGQIISYFEDKLRRAKKTERNK